MTHALNIQKSAPQLKSCLALLLILIICGSNLSGFAATGMTGPTAEPLVADATPSPFVISPASGVLGKEYEVLVASNECLQDPSKAANQIKDLRLYAPAGSGLTVANVSQTECRIAAKVTIAGDAPLGAAQLWLVKKDSNPPAPQATVSFNVTAITQGPTPTGKGAVDVMWSVLPDGITNDNFGGKVARQFYCVEVTLGNDSGYDLQLASVGFTVPYSSNVHVIPNSGYRTVRGSLEAYQTLDARNFFVNGLKVLGPILTGFIPFFHVLSHRANYSEAINVISNPLEKGLENFWPDIVPAELDRLADQTFRDDVSTKTVIPNNVQSRILTFVPRRLLFPRKNSVLTTWPKKCSDTKDQECRPDNPQDVMTLLGQVVIIGKEIDYINRIRVVNAPFGTSVTDHTISGKVTDACNAGVPDVEMALNASDFVERKVKTDKSGAYTFANVPDGRTYTVTAKLGDIAFTAKSENTFTLSDTKNNLDFSTANYLLSGKITTKDGKSLEETVMVEISGGGLSKSVTGPADAQGNYLIPVTSTGATPNFKINLKVTKYDAPNAFDWSCDKREANFSITKKTSPAAP